MNLRTLLSLVALGASIVACAASPDGSASSNSEINAGASSLGGPCGTTKACAKGLVCHPDPPPPCGASAGHCPPAGGHCVKEPADVGGACNGEVACKGGLVCVPNPPPPCGATA